MGRSLGAIGAALLCSAVFAGSASARDVEPGTRVGPDIYIGSAPEHGDDDAGTPEQVEEVLDAKRDTEPSTKIVGGQPTTIEEWPWQAAILDGETATDSSGSSAAGAWSPRTSSSAPPIAFTTTPATASRP